jgi:hypothetical protein
MYMHDLRKTTRFACQVAATGIDRLAAIGYAGISACARRNDAAHLESLPGRRRRGQLETSVVVERSDDGGRT